MSQKIIQEDITALVKGVYWPDDEWTIPSIRRCLGQKLVAIARDELWVQGIQDPRLEGDLELLFDNDQRLRLTITHMCGVVVVPASIEQVELAADQMVWKRKELTAVDPWSSLIHSQLIAVSALIKPDIGYGYLAGVCGLLFLFSNGIRIGYENWDYDSGRFSFEPSGGAWTEGQLVEWLRVV